MLCSCFCGEEFHFKGTAECPGCGRRITEPRKPADAEAAAFADKMAAWFLADAEIRNLPEVTP